MDHTDHLFWTETTLRDGQQSLWTTRMTAAMILPVLSVMDRAGFDAIECMGTAVMDACVRYLKENPWERIRLIRERVRHTPLSMIAPSQFFSVNRQLPEDVVALLIKTCARNGIDRFWIMDTLNDTRTLHVPVQVVRETGGSVLSGVCFAVSPVHTDAYFAARAAEVAALDVDGIVLKDANGLLTPERARTLVPALREVAGDLPVYVHSHCVTAFGPATNLKAVERGAAGLWTAASPLANGSSLPASESMARSLRRKGYAVRPDAKALDEIAAHFHRMARRHSKPVGRPAEYDPDYFRHQMPGGMASNFRAQLAQHGIEHRWEDVRAEMPTVREELGWPPMLTPFSQYVATQATLNVLYGRYNVWPEEIEKLILGHYGKTPAPTNPEVLDRVGGGHEPTTAAPGELLPPLVGRMHRDHGPFASDEELLLAILFMPDRLRALRGSSPVRLRDDADALLAVIREASRHPAVRSLNVAARRSGRGRGRQNESGG